MGFGGSGGSGGTIGSATDVALNNPSNNQVLTFDGTVGKWRNLNSATGFADPTTTKGDLIVHGSSTTRLPVGVDGHVLTADASQSNGVRWAAIGGVTSLNSQTGAVTISKTDVGLANVDNTSDATKNSATVVLTNKTISGASNSLSDIPQSAITGLNTALSSKADASTVVGQNIYVYNAYADAPALPVNTVVVSITGA